MLSQDRPCSNSPARKLNSFRVVTPNPGCKDRDIREAPCCKKNSRKVLKDSVKSVFKMCYHFNDNFLCNFSDLFNDLDFCYPALQQFLHLCSPKRAYIFLSKKQGQNQLICSCLWTPFYIFSHSGSIGHSLTHFLVYQFLCLQLLAHHTSTGLA